MSRDLFEIVQKMDIKCVETQIVLQCGPLIAGLKASNLLIVDNKNVKKVTEIIAQTEIVHVILWETEENSLYTIIINRRIRK